MGLRELATRLLIMAALFGAVMGAAWLYHYIAIAKPTGQACRRNDDCRSEQCLIRRNSLLPSMAGGGTCTVTCTSDADCPSSMTCGEATDTATVGGVMLSGKGQRLQLCMPR